MKSKFVVGVGAAWLSWAASGQAAIISYASPIGVGEVAASRRGIDPVVLYAELALPAPRNYDLRAGFTGLPIEDEVDSLGSVDEITALEASDRCALLGLSTTLEDILTDASEERCVLNGPESLGPAVVATGPAAVEVLRERLNVTGGQGLLAARPGQLGMRSVPTIEVTQATTPRWLPEDRTRPATRGRLRPAFRYLWRAARGLTR